MKGFVILLLGVIFVSLITSSLPSIAVDDSGGNNVVSEDADKLDVVPTKSPEYKIYLHVIVRNAQDQLVSVSETMDGGYFAHEITDYAFDHSLPLVNGVDIKSDATVLPPTGKKEIIIIDNIKYEKVQYSDSYMFNSENELISKWALNVCGGEHVRKYTDGCARIFGTTTITVVYLEVDDVITTNWTVLREFN